MNKKLLMPIAAAVLTVAAIMPAKGWNGVGHSVIAYIAEQHLTPEAKEKCRGYLHHTLPYYASWMDYWRNCPGFEATSKTHAVPVDETFRHIRNDEKNAVYHIIRIQKKMKKYNKMQDSLVRDNLKYLIHLVGDMHCPSHTRYEDQPKYKSYSIYINGKKNSSHHFWDSSLSTFHKGWKCEDYYRNLDNATPEQIGEICKGTPADWAYENALAMRETFELLPRHGEYNDVPEATKERMKTLSEAQAVKAGYRLAAILNAIFAK